MDSLATVLSGNVANIKFAIFSNLVPGNALEIKALYKLSLWTPKFS